MVAGGGGVHTRLGDRSEHEPSLCKARTILAPLALDADLIQKEKRGYKVWIKKHIRTPSGEPFCDNLLAPGNWLKYNIAGDLHLLHLGIAEKEYWMILKEEHLRYFRDKAYNNI